MRTVDEAGKLGRAFRLGWAFAFGKRFCAQGVASDEARWITVHPNGRGTTSSGDKAKGQPVLIDGDTGEVLGGMGGKFNGRHISAVPKRGKQEQHGAQQVIEYRKNREQIESQRKAKETTASIPTSIFADRARAEYERAKSLLESFDLEAQKAKYSFVGSYSAERYALADKERLEKQVKSGKRQITAAQKKDQELTDLAKELLTPGAKKDSPYARYWEDLKKDLLGLSGHDKEISRLNAAEGILKRAKQLKDYDKQAEANKTADARKQRIKERFTNVRSYAATEMGQRVKKIFEEHKGKITEASVQHAGSVVFDTFSALPDIEKFRGLAEELSVARKESSNFYDEHRHSDWSDENRQRYNDLISKKSEIANRLRESRVESAKSVREFVSQIRQVNDLQDQEMMEGFVKKTKSEATRSVLEAQKLFPKEWVESFLDRGEVLTKSVQRGYFWASPGVNGDVIAVSGKRDEALRCAIHELGHRLEATNPVVLKLEEEFYNRRTAGESLETLKRVTGNSSYSSKEKTRKDNFLNPYMGKDYGGKAYELVSMGLEMLYTQPHELIKDPDYAKFILGIVALT